MPLFCMTAPDSVEFSVCRIAITEVCGKSIFLLAALLTLPFVLVLGLGFGGRLPLHIFRAIRASAVQRLDMVNDVARALAAMLAG